MHNTSNEPPLRTLSISLSGELRSYCVVLDNHLETIVAPNTQSYKIWLFLAVDADTPPGLLARLQRADGVQNVSAIRTRATPKQCGHHFCHALYKQRLLLEVLRTEPRRDMYLHTRFDAHFSWPLLLRELDIKWTAKTRTPNVLFVARSTWFFDPHHASGNISSQSGEGIKWRNGTYSLRNSVPDYAFAGAWEEISTVLARYDVFELYESTPSSSRLEYIFRSPEFFLQRYLALHGIEFTGTSHDSDRLFQPPSARIRFMVPRRSSSSGTRSAIQN
jgi:hypothetical protein